MRRFAGLLTALLVVAVLSGCSVRSDIPPAVPSGVPTGSAPPQPTGGPTAQVAAGWLQDGRTIGVVTWGSSSCVPVGGAATVAGDTITVPLAAAAGQRACTSDLAPRVTLVATPAGVDPAQDYDLRVVGSEVSGEADLDGVDGLAGPSAPPTDGPSAGWTGEDGLFVIVTFGSGCRPRVEDAAATGPAEVTVTFARAPHGQMCDMSYGPRGSVAHVSGLQESEGVTAVLNGDGLDRVRVPVVGEN